MKKAIVVGGAGALGRAIVKELKAVSIAPISIDISSNDDADHNLLVKPNTPLHLQYKGIWTELNKHLIGASVPGVFCAAGGWMGGSIGDENFLEVLDQMNAMNLATAALSANLSVRLLSQEGILVLTGAEAALSECPTMISYGASKVSTHYLVASIAKDETFNKKSAKAFAILPSVIDTPTNRQFMPNADHGSWTKVRCDA